MNRGKVDIEKIELQHALELFKDEDTPLVNKLKSAIALDTENITIELSEQEVESILDALEPPGNSQVADELRGDLTTFFQELTEANLDSSANLE